MFKSKSTQEVENTFNTTSLTKNVMQQITSTSQKVSAIGTNVQMLDVKVGNVTNCKFRTKQTIDSKIVSTGTITQDTTNNLKTLVTNDITNKANVSLSQTSGFLSLPADKQQSIKQTVNNSLISITERLFKVETLQELSSSVVNTQGEKVEIGNVDCTKNGDLDFTQDIVSKVVAEAIIDNLTKNIFNDETLNALSNEFKSESDQVNKGIFESLFGSLGDMIRGNKSVFIIVSIICLLLIALGIFVKFFKGGGVSTAAASPIVISNRVNKRN